MKSLAFFLLLTPALWAAPKPAALPADAAQRVARVLNGTASAFVLLDPASGRTVRFDEARCKERMSPFSTFKIPNSLIILETGVLPGPDAVVRWDRKKRPPQPSWPEAWKQDHSLRTAIRVSAVWFYQEAAIKVGPERMARWVKRFRYGNQDISGGIDGFWLADSLRISADEQVEFVRAFHEGRLGISPRTTATVKEILPEERTAESLLKAKTGGGPVAPGKFLGWYVGYVETRGNVYYFALNTDGPTYEAIKDKRIDLAKAALRAAGVL